MTETKVFAPGLDRTPECWIKFPSDVAWRKRLFTQESMAHPAKMNLYLLQAIIDYVSKPGDKILDPMSGSGSLMIATLPPDQARSVYLIEETEHYYQIQQQNKELFINQHGAASEKIVLLHGPCQDYLPLTGFLDHIVFSPPYAGMMTSKSWQSKESQVEYIGKMFPGWNGRDSLNDYIGGPKNLARLNDFLYNQAMMKIYAQLLESLKPGGTMTVVIRDKTVQGKPTGLSDWVMRTCIRTGFNLLGWEKRGGINTGFTQRQRAQGNWVVNWEDIIIFQHPEQ